VCGIFGLIIRNDASIARTVAVDLFSKLFRLSETRGKESAGLQVWLPSHQQAWTLKGPLAASAFIASKQYVEALHDALPLAYPSSQVAPSSPFCMLGHSRLVTNGIAELDENNQPVRRSGVSVIHNGIVVNVDELWLQHSNIQRSAQVDTEIIAALLADALHRGYDMAGATRHVYAQIRGSASIAWVQDRRPHLVLATNTGDLYVAIDEAAGCLVFASELFILKRAIDSLPSANTKVTWLSPGNALLVDIRSLEHNRFDLFGTEIVVQPSMEVAQETPVHHDMSVGTHATVNFVSRTADESLLRYHEDHLRAVRRCSCCVLPETFPFIEYDAHGVCNYCRNYVPRYKGVDPAQAKRSYIEYLRQYRSRDGSPDAIVAFSGGRDSSYGLHLIKREMGFTPITFTYDWGMVTDLARRNVARICGQLGIQNILVSADIRKKRENIRKNVSAWLRKPDLGLIPLFMAGDKHFFSVVNQLKRQTGIGLDLWCSNPLENTDFKSGFCGVRPDFEKKAIDQLSLARKAYMAMHYAKAFVSNPALINTSLIDTTKAFWSYYFEPRAGMHLIFDHIVWNEDEVNNVLRREYDWETAEDTRSTWRIGDGTAPFYNYIYVTARGFSEFDTFRSNQIREGILSRESGLQSVLEENRPRGKSIRWYLDALELPFNETIRTINRLDPLR